MTVQMWKKGESNIERERNLGTMSVYERGNFFDAITTRRDQDTICESQLEKERQEEW